MAALGKSQSEERWHSRHINQHIRLDANTMRLTSLPESEESNRIDSNLFHSSSGSAPLLAFGSYLRGLFQIPLTLPPTQLNGHVVEIAHNDSNVAMEAAYQFRWTVEGMQW